MAPTTNFTIAHEYAKARSPRRISSNGWNRFEIVLKKTEEDESNEERDEVEFLMKKSSSGMQRPRVCANCHTSKTPLWRSGPTGPKSLCNACGIRFRKRQLEADAGKNPLPFFNLAGEEASSKSPSDVLTLEEMKELQKAKQRRILRFIAKHRVQEMRRRLLERSSRDMMQAAQLLMSLSKGAA